MVEQTVEVRVKVLRKSCPEGCQAEQKLSRGVIEAPEQVRHIVHGFGIMCCAQRDRAL